MLDEASTSPPSDTHRLLSRFFDAQTRFDLDTVLTCWHDDAVMRTPYAPAPLPKEIRGKNALARTFGALFAGSSAIRLYDVELIATQRNELWLSRWTFEIALKSGATYTGSDIGTFVVDDGLIREYTEYFDAIVCAKTYGFPLVAR